MFLLHVTELFQLLDKNGKICNQWIFIKKTLSSITKFHQIFHSPLCHGGHHSMENPPPMVNIIGIRNRYRCVIVTELWRWNLTLIEIGLKTDYRLWDGRGVPYICLKSFKCVKITEMWRWNLTFKNWLLTLGRGGDHTIYMSQEF